MTDSPKTPENFIDGADLEPIVDSVPAAPSDLASTEPIAADAGGAEAPASAMMNAPQFMPPRGMGGGGDNFFMRAVQADKAYTKFFFGFLLITIGCLMPWTEGTQLLGYYTVLGALILVVGLYGMWRCWLAMVTNKFTLGPVGLNFIVFFWGLLQIMTLGNVWKHELDPEIVKQEVEAGRTAPENEKKGMLPSVLGMFGDDHDFYSVRRNVAHFGPGRLISSLGSTYVTWVFIASMFGVMSKKKPTNGPAPGRGPAGGGRRAPGAPSAPARTPRAPRDGADAKPASTPAGTPPAPAAGTPPTQS